MKNSFATRALTFVHPGLGHLYAGRHKDALFSVAVTVMTGISLLWHLSIGVLIFSIIYYQLAH